MKTIVYIWLGCIVGLLCSMTYGYGHIRGTKQAIAVANACHVADKKSLENCAKEIQKICNKALENEDREWSEKYNIVLKRLNNVEANMDTLDVWTGDKITVNYKNGMTKHFIVEEHRIVEAP